MGLFALSTTKGGKRLEKQALHSSKNTISKVVDSELHLYNLNKQLNRHGKIDKMTSKEIKGISAENAGRRTSQRTRHEQLKCKLPGGKGFDSTAVKYDANGTVLSIIINESKFSQTGVGQLSNPKKVKQMGRKWIKNTLEEMLNCKDLEVKKTAELISDNWDKVKLKGNVLDPDGVNRWADLTHKINKLHQ